MLRSGRVTDPLPHASSTSCASPRLIVHETSPLNAEPPLDVLGASFVTPTPRFYIRTHGSIPQSDPARHRLRVEGSVGKPLELCLADIRARFPRRTVVAALQCAGNRRTELASVRPVDGTPWQQGAIGNAEWTGAPLAEVLRAAGCETTDSDGLHVAFASIDEVEEEGRRFSFGGSIPLTKALQPEVLLAYEMNGEPLAPEHGFPLRVVVPGYVAARSVKWLGAIRVQSAPSDNYFQRYDYKLFPPDTDASNVDWEAGTMLNELPVNSAICEPADGAEVSAGPVTLRGYAMAGGRTIERVEVSADDGRSWLGAACEHSPGEPWSWTLWKARLELAPGEHEIAVRAWDAAAQTQPERTETVWNFKGYMNTAWHRIRVRAR